MTQIQKRVLIGMVLGDAYLQKTGKKNARIRLEHSSKQKEYLKWKVSFFPEFFQGKLTELRRYNKEFGKDYEYVRAQSYASPQIGKFRQLFYDDSGVKIIPNEIGLILTSPLSLAVWFMDDGYYYKRDKMAYFYLPNPKSDNPDEFQELLNALSDNFSLNPSLKRKTRGWCLVLSVKETEKLVNIVSPHIIDSMAYKLGE